MNKLISFLRETLQGKSVIRIFMDQRLRDEILHGKVLDLGSGEHNAYRDIAPMAHDADYVAIDRQSDIHIDFETDPLPYSAATFDTVLLLNVLEHIYNHRHLLREAKRVKKGDGNLIGFVPFLMWYHPSHRDYYRYTGEALERILVDEGYREIRVETLYSGPYLSAYQMIYPTIPRIVRPLVFSIAYWLDLAFRSLRPVGASRYALGYFFTAR